MNSWFSSNPKHTVVVRNPTEVPCHESWRQSIDATVRYIILADDGRSKLQFFSCPFQSRSICTCTPTLWKCYKVFLCISNYSKTLSRRIIYALFSQLVVGVWGIHPWTTLGDFLTCPPLEKILRVPMFSFVAHCGHGSQPTRVAIMCCLFCSLLATE